MNVIQWLVQTTAAHPDLLRGQPPPGLLSEAELEHFAGFSAPKRRQDWLLGRWTAKLLLQTMIEEAGGGQVGLEAMTILPGADGAPRASFTAPFEYLDSGLSLSISHSHGSSLCAAVARGDWPLGADLELIEPRSENFAADFFTEEELAQIAQAPGEAREMLVTAVWSAKEAALKAVHLGLRQDTRVVSCQFTGLEAAQGVTPFGVEEERGAVNGGGGGWRPFGIAWRRGAAEAGLPRLAGWWRVGGGYVLTLAVGDRVE